MIAVLGSLRMPSLLSSYQIWPEIFWNVARSHFSTKTAWKDSNISAAIFADKMLVCQIFCWLVGLFFYLILCMCVFLHRSICKSGKKPKPSTIKWDAFICNILQVHFRYNSLSILYRVNPFHCDTSFPSHHPIVVSMHPLFGRNFFAVYCGVQVTLTLPLKTKDCAVSFCVI